MKNLALILIIAILGAIGYNSYKAYSIKAATHTPSREPGNSHVGSKLAKDAGPAFRCDGRTHCSHMTSCAEATYFLQHCPNTKMDGNGDGVPCERQWCN